jgi:hypothetical protein
MRTLFISAYFLSAIIVTAQVDVTAGMGIAFVNNSSLSDYINANFPSDKDLGTFNSSFDLSLEADYTISENFEMGIEYVYNIFAYTTTIFGGAGVYDLSYKHHKPSLLAYYIIPGSGYKFKFGGGVGFRYVDFDEKIIQQVNYSTSGIGFLLRAQGLTTLGGNFYANLGGTFRYDLPGEPATSNGNEIKDQFDGGSVNINSIVFSVNIGVTYSF